MTQGRYRRLTMKDLRPDWVYLGKEEAAILVGVGHARVDRAIRSGELGRPVVLLDPETRQARKVYRLDHVLALRDGRKG